MQYQSPHNMSLLNNMLSCLCGSSYEATSNTTEESANEFVNKLRLTEKHGNALKVELQGIIEANGWREYFQEVLMDTLEKAVHEGHHMGPVFEKALNEAWIQVKKIKEFADENPAVYYIVAIGVLAIMAPWLLEALGFAESGIFEGMVFSF
jgi:hypothetical protein